MGWSGQEMERCVGDRQGWGWGLLKSTKGGKMYLFRFFSTCTVIPKDHVCIYACVFFMFAPPHTHKFKDLFLKTST